MRTIITSRKTILKGLSVVTPLVLILAAYATAEAAQTGTTTATSTDEFLTSATTPDASTTTAILSTSTATTTQSPLDIVSLAATTSSATGTETLSSNPAATITPKAAVQTASASNDLVVATTTTLTAGEHTFDTVLVESGATLILASDSNVTDYQGVRIEANEFVVEEGGVVSGTGTGFPRNTGPGSTPVGTKVSANHSYGNPLGPNTLGSGGIEKGSFGGGSIIITADDITVNGTVESNGVFGGTGGAIHIISNTLSGAGVIEARGGNFRPAGTSNDLGGTGGQVFIETETSSFSGMVAAPGGTRPSSGQIPRFVEAGSVGIHLTSSNQLTLFDRWALSPDLSINNFGEVIAIGATITTTEDQQIIGPTTLTLSSTTVFTLGTSTALTPNTLTLTDTARLVMSSELQVPTLIVTDTAVVTAALMTPLEISAIQVVVSDGASITTDGLGYGAGEGPGSPPLDSRDGGTHTYGNPTAPDTFGSASWGGWRGGGVVRIEAAEIQNDGRISANGAQSASGGSVWVTTNTLTGDGTFQADGGDFGFTAVTYRAGAGGRVAVYFDDAGSWTGTSTAAGGRNFRSAGTSQTFADDGTVVFAENPCVGTCASSVLFLPGIQASRLYVNDDGTEKMLWHPDTLSDDEDVLRLAMTEDGESIEEVYVRDVIESAPEGSMNPDDAVYLEFIDFLENLVVEGGIRSFESFAYDWRYDVYDIVEDGVQYENERRYLTDVIIELAAESHTGKVTIIGHSNGGLVGKALIDKLVNAGQEDLIDNFVMIGAPQLGTPQAIGSLLHGTGQGLNFELGQFKLPIVSEAAARSVAQNLPSAYGLLPGQKYFEEANDIVVLFDTGNATEEWRDMYGNALNNQSELDDFLVSSVNDREAVAYRDVDGAITANSVLLQQARVWRERQDNWQAPSNIAVTSIAGTGRDTISGFRYRTFTERDCVAGAGCVTKDFYRPTPIMSKRGDETVMSISASNYNQASSSFFIDLPRIIDVTGETYNHRNLTESEIIQDFLRAILNDENFDSQFISEIEPEYDDQSLLIGANSPVYTYIEDQQGRRTGRIDETTVLGEIPDTQWFTVAGGSYILTPSDIEYEVKTSAYAEGSVTFTVDQIDSGGQTDLHTIYIPIITASTSIDFSYDGSAFSTLQVDFESDDVVDEERNLEGELIEQEITYDTLKTAIMDLDLRRRHERPLLNLARLAERFDTYSDTHPIYTRVEKHLLRKLEQYVRYYKRRGYITREQRDETIGIIRVMRNN